MCVYVDIYFFLFVKLTMFLFLTVFLSVVIAYILKFHYEYVRAFYLSLKIDGPRAYPLVGNGLMFINKTSDGRYW